MKKTFKDLSNVAKRIITMLAVGSMISVVAVGCANIPNGKEKGEGNTQNERPSVEPSKSFEEITEAGGEVSLNDVNNAMEYFTYLYVSNAVDAVNYSDATVEFVSITPDYVLDANKKAVTLPFYSPSFTDYVVRFKYSDVFEDGTKSTSAGQIICLPGEEFAFILERTGVSKLQITREYLDGFEHTIPTLYQQTHLIGQEVYEAVVIDKEFISSHAADKEVLEAFLKIFDKLIAELEKKMEM